MVKARPLADRFWEKVDKSGDCWLWTGAITNGYGVIHSGATHVFAHRAAYEMSVQPIPEGLVIDHLCRVPRCVNPSHLEAVTHAENVRRGNACLRGAARKMTARRVEQKGEETKEGEVNMADDIETIEPHTVVAEQKRYPPKWLSAYAGPRKMGPQEALDYVLKKNRSNSDAARELGISPLTLYRNMKKWGVRVER